MLKKITVLYLAFLLLICGCAPKGSDTPAGESQNAAHFTLAMHAPASLHPLKTKLSSNVLIFDLIYDSLVYVDREMHPVPYLAESCSVSADRKTISFTLRSGVLWHDGAAFTAADVAHTINTIREIGPEGIYYDRLAYISDVRVLDMLHFDIVLTKPHVTVLNLLDFPIIPSHRSDLETNAVGTGQYKLASYAPQKSLTLTKNESWRLSEMPQTEEITVKFLERASDEASMVRIGEVTAATASLEGIGGISAGTNMEITKYPTLQYEYVGTNFRNMHLASYRVRYAISHAINREKLIEDAYLGYGTPVCVPVPPTSYLYIGDEADKKQFNTEKAKALLYEDGYAEENGVMTKATEDGGKIGLSLSILVNEENEYRKKYAVAMVQMLGNVGIRAYVETVPFEEYQTRIFEGDYDMYVGGCRFSQDLSYDFLLGEGKVAADGYTSSEMDAALSALGYATADAEIENAYKSFEDVFLRDLPFLGICFLDGALVHSPRLTGIGRPACSKLYRNIGQWKLEKEG